jgi:lambda family phage portal protein
MSRKTKNRAAANRRVADAPPVTVGDATVQQQRARSQYMKGEASPFYFNWRPALRDAKTDVQSSYTQAVARTIDAIHNSGWLAGCIEQSKGNIVGGNGLRLAFKPDGSALGGWSPKELNDWARLVERRFEMWGNDKDECDAAGKATLAQMQEQAVDTYYSHGEVLGLMPRLDRPNALTQVKLALQPPHKLTQETIESVGMHQGVTMGDWGYPLKYRICMPTGYGTEEDVDVLARTPDNLQQVMHIFKGAPGQIRGITPFVHALKIIKQYEQLSDATLTKAMIDAIFAATMESSAPTNDILQALQDEDEQGIGAGNMTSYLSAKAAWYENTKIDLGRGGKIAHLYPGEKLSLTTSTRISGDYEAFAKFLLREIARCLGLSFEAVTGDYSGATYSSVRMSSSELWPLTVSRRTNIIARMLHELFCAWLDEEVTSGRIPFKGGVFAYQAVRKFVCRTDWRGPPKPQADDLKAAKAMEVLKALGIASDEQLCAELGTDYEDVYEQRAREMEMRKELDLPEHKTMDPDPEAEALVKEPAA